MILQQAIQYSEMSIGYDREQIYPIHQGELESVLHLHHKHLMSRVMLVYQEMSVLVLALQQLHSKSMEISKQQVLLFLRIGTIFKQVLLELLLSMDTTVSVQEIVVVSVMEHDELSSPMHDLLV